MARNTRKKQPEAHKIDCAEVFASLRDLEKMKGIPVDYMVERMKQTPLRKAITLKCAPPVWSGH